MKKVLVGMSGGVDSSAAALILSQQGYEVCGCTMRLYSNADLGDDYPEEGGCCSLSDVEDAKAVCRKIGIDHITLNLTDEFRSRVMAPFVSGYLSGETPNPCIECNRCMKLDLMLKRAELLGFDYIATGHYARIERDEENGIYRLLRPRDRRKDQTYVLYMMTQYTLAHTLFPLCDIDKLTVRSLAEEYGLVTSHKPDSQDICFVPDGDYADFIRRFTGKSTPPGNFIDSKGNILGTHSGIERYTIGQRRGLGVTFGKPVYVTDKNAESNTVTLGEERELYRKTITLRDVNICSGVMPDGEMQVTAKTRYNAPDKPAVLYPSDKNGLWRIEFTEPVRGAAKGQACVFYDGDNVVGGGIIC
ncbi:MAG: tRNA 2-thiouridine(34) synthase MnmA [Oscillospiraceae bacterium]|nr:tRNA 2-thiouridine(34) synthase MnmA [Oscillospiraceae bacterium]